MLQIRAALPDELNDVLAIMDDAAAWLQSVGVTEQWPAAFSDDLAWVERFRHWIDESRVFVALDDAGRTTGCFRLLDVDNHIWPGDSLRCVYLHSLAIRRDAAKSGVASALLAWACEYARSQGADELRLDCWAGNERLKRYYLDAGFESRGEAHIPEAADQLAAGREYYVAKFAKKVR